MRKSTGQSKVNEFYLKVFVNKVLKLLSLLSLQLNEQGGVLQLFFGWLHVGKVEHDVVNVDVPVDNFFLVDCINTYCQFLDYCLNFSLCHRKLSGSN